MRESDENRTLERRVDDVVPRRWTFKLGLSKSCNEVDRGRSEEEGGAAAAAAAAAGGDTRLWKQDRLDSIDGRGPRQTTVGMRRW